VNAPARRISSTAALGPSPSRTAGRISRASFAIVVDQRLAIFLARVLWACVGHHNGNLSAVNHLLVLPAGLTHWLFSCGHFRLSIYQGDTMSDVIIPGGKIRAFVERIENLDSEIQELSEQKKEVFAEAKGDGFDIKILKEIVKLRKQDEEERDERESMLDLYMRAMEQAAPEKVAKAA
jgi:uncharacterized protein (UPF0335 family)